MVFLQRCTGWRIHAGGAGDPLLKTHGDWPDHITGSRGAEA